MASKKILLSRAFLPAMLCSASTSSFSLLAATRHSHVHGTVRPHRVVLSRFLSSSEPPSNDNKKRVNTKVNFSLADSDEDENDGDRENDDKKTKKMADYKPYDPFSKKPVVEDPKDPKDLQEIFHKMRTDGLFDHAVKMFDGLSKDGLTHEALELFGQIKDRGEMPDVVAHTAVIEAYTNAGKTKEALKGFLRMLRAGVAPNAYTYAVLIKGLAADDKFVGDARKYVVEMMEKGMRPNAGVCVAVFEGLVRGEKEDGAKELLEQMKARGFTPYEKDVREVLKGKRGHMVRPVMSILFGK